MALIKELAIGMSVDPNPLVRGCDRSVKAMDEFSKSADRTKGAMEKLDLTPRSAAGSGPTSPGEGMADQAAQQSAEMRSAFASGLAPLQQVAAKIQAQFDRVGGTIVTLARRLDSEMKFKTLDASLTAIQDRLKSSFAKGAVGAIQSVNRIKNALDSLGDVARRPLSRMFNFTPAIGQAEQLSSRFRTIAPVVERATGSVKRLGTEIAISLGAFGLAFKAVQFFKSGVVEASNLNESINKMGVIFGQSSGIVQKATDEMAAKFGVVRSSFIDTSALFGQLLQGMGGQTEKASAETSVQLAKLAADASSILNVSFEESAGKIASALRGQSEPISAFGVDVQEAAAKQEALRIGLIKTSRDLTTQEKVAARTSLIIRGLGVAQGDLANTIDAPANAMRRFQGNLKNMASEIGTAFMPILQKGIGLLNEFASWISEAFVRNKGSISAFTSNAGKGLDYLGAVLRNLPVSWEIVKLKFMEGASNILSILETIPANLKIIGEYVANNWSKLITDGMNAAGAALTNFGKNINNLWTAVQDFLAGKGFNFEFTPLLDGFKATAEKLPELVKPQFVSMQKEIDAQMAILDKDVADRAKKTATAAAAVKPKPLAMTDAKDELKAQKKLAAEAKKVFEDTRRPAEKYQIAVGKLQKLFDAKAIDQTTFARGKVAAREDAFGKFGDKPLHAGALTAGSTEAYSAQLRFAAMGQDKTDEPMKEVAKKTTEQVDISKQILTGINKIAEKAGSAVGGAVGELFAI